MLHIASSLFPFNSTEGRPRAGQFVAKKVKNEKNLLRIEYLYGPGWGVKSASVFGCPPKRIFCRLVGDLARRNGVPAQSGDATD